MSGGGETPHWTNCVIHLTICNSIAYAQADFHGLPAPRAACSNSIKCNSRCRPQAGVRRSARPREYLIEREIEKLMDAAACNPGVIGTPLPSCWPIGMDARQ